MKKIIIVAGLAMSLIIASAVSAFAATNLDTSAKKYLPTPGGTTIESGKYVGTSGPSAGYAPNDVKSNLPSGAPSKAPDGGPAGSLVTKIHSNYASNTNACAACHATHTGVGESLLQWDGMTETCMACHDGTAGVATYNVSGGEIGTTGAITNGGLFPTNDNTANSKSMHDVFGGVQVTAAPGGNFAATGASTAADKGNFKEDFSCVSCHSPHGNGANFRILDPNVNGFANLHTNKTAATWEVVTAPDATDNTKWVVKAAFNDVNSTAPFYAYLLTGPYPLKVGVTANSAYTVDNNNGYTEITLASAQTTAPTVTGNVAAKVKGTVDNYLQASEKVTYINGFSDFCGACHTDYNTANYTVGSTTNGYGDRSFAQGTFTTANDGTTAKNPLSQDAQGKLPVYIPSHAVSIETGTFTQAYRHTVGLSAGKDGHGNAVNGMPFETRKYFVNGSASFTGYYLSCLSCHVAHGTDNNYWKAYADQRGTMGVPVADGGTALSSDAKAIYNTSEVFDTSNASTPDAGNGNYINSRGSNLKRMPNMAACEGCHTKGLNNQGVNATYNN
ncbi:MAG: hypothetical protein M0Z55_10510 [Peptococcaceae bacterium]|nr:hypothetical protein [Peptococcaceae bacterium]